MLHLSKSVFIFALACVLSVRSWEPRRQVAKTGGFCPSAVSFRAYAKQDLEYCYEKLNFQKELVQEQAAVCEQTIGNLTQAFTDQVQNCRSLLDDAIESETLLTSQLTKELGKCISANNPELVSIKKSDLIEYSTGTYYISKSFERTNWYMANLFCKNNGMELASVETKEESDFLISMFGGSTDKFWLSGTDLGYENYFYWIGVGILIDPFWYFEVGQPDNANNNENCVQYFVHPDISDATYKWNDANCEEAERFVCEVES
ncbi:Hypothetical predicted protein [Cloeon dipterum]|uniref:C-type lectin domain-containing protein n=1 Tax=Cloeon dipterum TaxID=197152 RepID=A0A8S1DHQ4_9INSE|nr:Hypothetical predicted protein [Cloeon dipterum]